MDEDTEDYEYNAYDLDKFYEYMNYDPGEEIPDEVHISRVVAQVVCPLLVLIGTPLSLLTVHILSKISKTVLPCAWYMMVGSTIDILLFVVSSCNCWLSSWTRHDLLMDMTVISKATCKMVVYADHLLMQLSNWCTVCFVYGTLWHASRTSTCALNNRASHVKDVMALIVALLMCFNMQYFWTYDLVYSGVWITEPGDFLNSETVLVLDTEAKQCVFRGTGMHKEANNPEHYFVSALLDSMLADCVPAVLFLIYFLLVLYTRFKTPESAHHVLTIEEDATQIVIPSDFCSRTPLSLAVIQFFVCMPNFVFTLTGSLIPNDTLLTQARWELAVTILSLWQHVVMATRFLVFYKTSHHFKEHVQQLCCHRLKCLTSQQTHTVCL